MNGLARLRIGVLFPDIYIDIQDGKGYVIITYIDFDVLYKKEVKFIIKKINAASMLLSVRIYLYSEIVKRFKTLLVEEICLY